MIARFRDGEEVVYGDGRGSKCAFGATIVSRIWIIMEIHPSSDGVVSLDQSQNGSAAIDTKFSVVGLEDIEDE